MAQPKGFFKEGGKTKPYHEKKGINENDFSQKSIDDKIAITKKTGGSYPSKYYEIVKKMQDKANPNKKLGRGAEVELIDLFGLKDIPIGTKGIVTDHIFGRDRPSVKFNGNTYVIDKEKLKVLKGSSDFLPIQYDRIEAKNKTKLDLEKRIKEFTTLTDQKDGWFSGFEYLDNGEGDSIHLPFSVHVKEGEVDIHVQKRNLPNRWQWQFNDIREGIVEKIEAAIGVAN